MQRRSLLGRLAALGVLGGVAGCTAPNRGDGGEPGGSDPDGDAEVVETRQVGSREGVAFPENQRPHEVAVVNGGEVTREIEVDLQAADHAVGLSERWTIPVDHRVVLRIATPDEYTLTVGVGDGEPASTTIPSGYFDCNDSRTTATVGPEGELETETLTTLVACPPPAVAESQLEVTETGCAGGDQEAPTVRAREETLQISGTIQVPNPCHEAAIERVDYTGETDTLSVRITQTEPPGDQACIECVGAVEYEAELELMNGYPGTVVVEHAHFGRVDEVQRTHIDG